MNKMKQKAILLIRYLLGGMLFAGGAILANLSCPFFACILFLILCILEIYLIYQETHSFLDYRFILSLTWLIGIGLSSLKLSNLQDDFSIKTWLSLGLFYFSFLAVFEWKKEHLSIENTEPISFPEPVLKRIEWASYIVAGLGLICFLIESIVFDFAYPILVKDTPHAYSEFHITGIHYFIVSLFFVHVLTVILWLNGWLSAKKKFFFIILNAVCFAVPILLLSKMQVLFAIAIPLLAWIIVKKPSKKVLLRGSLIAFIVVAGLFFLIVLGRQYPEGYLAEIFDFKNQHVPGGLQYIYIYIVNNFENFNVLVENLTTHSFGIRSLFPFFALTGLKFVPAIAAFIASVPSYFNKSVLTTTTILYDVYGDFGIFGTVLLGILLALLCRFCMKQLQNRKSLLGVLLCPQLMMVVFLSFFTTWLSNASIWFWFIASLAIALFCKIDIQAMFHRKEKETA